MTERPAASRPLEQRELGATGVAVTRLILGTMCFGGIGSARRTWGKWGLDEEASLALLDAAEAFGITTLDTAHTYTGGQSETVIGKWLQRRGHHEDIVLASKAGMYTSPDGKPDLSAQNLTTSVDGSLERLGVERIDLYIAHVPDPDTPIEETLETFESLRQAGKIGAVGGSNLTESGLRAALDAADRLGIPGYQWVQNSYSLFHDGDHETVLPLCEERGLGYTPHTPLYGGLLSGKYIGLDTPPPGSRLDAKPADYDDKLTPGGREAVSRLAAEAQRRGVTTTALAIAWILADPRITAPIVGPVRPEHFDAFREALDLHLDEDEREELRTMVRGLTA